MSQHLQLHHAGLEAEFYGMNWNDVLLVTGKYF